MGNCTNNVFMIRPKHFTYNTQTSETNIFQNKLDLSFEETLKKVQEEFDSYVELLRNNGVHVEVFHDKDDVITPDSIFQDWTTFHKDGKAFTYPMYAANRRDEIRYDIIESLKDKGFVSEHISLEKFADDQKYLEGSGCIVMDREHKIAYCAESQRAHKDVFEYFCKKSGFKPLLFRTAIDSKTNQPIAYHTDIVLSVAETFALVCKEAIHKEDIGNLEKILQETGKEIIYVTYDQAKNFATNSIQLKSQDEKRLFVVSKNGYNSLNQEQIQEIEKTSVILSPDISTIEFISGGSARCMIGELFKIYK